MSLFKRKSSKKIIININDEKKNQLINNIHSFNTRDTKKENRFNISTINDSRDLKRDFVYLLSSQFNFKNLNYYKNIKLKTRVFAFANKIE